MSVSIKMIKEVLSHMEVYTDEVGNDDIKEFSFFLKDRLSDNPGRKSNTSFDKNKYKDYKQIAEVEFSALLTGLFRFAKHYIKKALSTTSFKTIDEFGFLTTLLKEGSLLKNELINTHLIEISSGSEIIKRLVKNGLISEFPDEKDKRAKRVSITDLGRKELLYAFDDMHKVSEIVIGNLSSEELYSALNVFNKLTYFHQHIHENDRNTGLGDLHDKYIEK